MTNANLQPEAPPCPRRKFPWLPVLFVAFLICNWALVASMYLLRVPDYITAESSSIGISIATISLILVAFGAIAVSTREVDLKALWPSLYAAAGLALFARFLYFALYPVGAWPGLWPALPGEWERAVASSLVYAAEMILVAGFCRVMFALRNNLTRLKAEQKRLEQEQAAHKQSQEQGRRLEQQLLQAQKMESIGRLAGGIAHDLNNMLTPILAYASMLEANIAPDDPARADLHEIATAAERARDITQQLLAFARKQALEMKPVNLNEIIVRFEKIMRSSLREDIEVRVDLAATGNVAADAGQIEQVIMNLVLNAQDAMPNGGTIMIESADVTLDQSYAQDHEEVVPGPHVMLLVSDTGEGMDKDTCDKIFEPFFTTKRTGKGVGLGLSTTHGIVKQHGGSIWVYSEPGKGTTFKIYFPKSDRAAAIVASPGPVAATRLPRGSGTVLVAEDNAQVRALAARVLISNGYTVLEAVDGKSAIQAAQAHPGQITLLVSDVVMPDMNGKVLYQYLAAKRPGLRVLYMSGYSDNVIAHHGVLESNAHFIQKPFSMENFLANVHQALS
ncbi:MAG TPA: ATP-binding protein [Candidatus Bathyarchaeia archaeon]|nr:ATP-binding protein [Candidatus Bathyarchaeia archaeon]